MQGQILILNLEHKWMEGIEGKALEKNGGKRSLGFLKLNCSQIQVQLLLLNIFFDGGKSLCAASTSLWKDIRFPVAERTGELEMLLGACFNCST